MNDHGDNTLPEEITEMLRDAAAGVDRGDTSVFVVVVGHAVPLTVGHHCMRGHAEPLIRGALMELLTMVSGADGQPGRVIQ